MIQFLEQNYSWLAVLVFDLLSLIFLLIRKRVKVVETPLDKTIVMLPGFISFAESKLGKGNGSEKLKLVLKLASKYYASVGGTDAVSDVLQAHIEAILSTPQKKGDFNEKV